MEQEYKWIMDDEEQIKNIICSKLISKYIINDDAVDMEATYYDDSDETLKKTHGALRKRKQNQKNICCLKLEQKSDSDCKKRIEYELEENDIYQALKKFPTIGASKEFCEELAKKQLSELCKIQFKRKIYNLNIEEHCIVELSFDIGKMIKKDKIKKFMEIELEFKEGEEELFHKFARKMEDDFKLKIQPLSKIEQSMKW